MRRVQSRTNVHTESMGEPGDNNSGIYSPPTSPSRTRTLRSQRRFGSRRDQSQLNLLQSKKPPPGGLSRSYSIMSNKMMPRTNSFRDGLTVSDTDHRQAQEKSDGNRESLPMPRSKYSFDRPEGRVKSITKPKRTVRGTLRQANNTLFRKKRNRKESRQSEEVESVISRASSQRNFNSKSSKNLLEVSEEKEVVPKRRIHRFQNTLFRGSNRKKRKNKMNPEYRLSQIVVTPLNQETCTQGVTKSLTTGYQSVEENYDIKSSFQEAMEDSRESIEISMAEARRALGLTKLTHNKKPINDNISIDTKTDYNFDDDLDNLSV